jgi:hypothetical protein
MINVQIIPRLSMTGENAGALNFFIEFKSPILRAESDIKNKNGDIFFNNCEEASLVC